MLNRGWVALAVAVLLPAIAFAGNNFNVKVGDSNPLAADARSFTDLTSGTSTTSIIRGDTVTWCWAGDCSGATSTFPEPHSTSSGVCNPGCNKGAVGGMSWDSGDGYKGTFGALTFSNSGTFTYFCDIHGASMQGTVVVGDHDSATHWQVINQPATSPQGNQFTITVQALDRNGNIDTGFNLPATLSVTGANSSFPTSVIISGGQGSASIVLRDIGGQTIQASGQSVTQSTVGVTVTATHFAVTAPAAAVAGAVVPVGVTAEDPFNAVVTGFVDPVTYTSSDGAAVLPTSHATLAKGVGGGSATFNTVGSQSLTCTDDNVAGVNGQTSVDVVPASCPSAPKTFSNTAPIAIPDIPPNPPSNITVSGMNGQAVGHLTVTFNGFTATCQVDPGFLLVGPGGQNFVLQNFAGSCTNASSTVSSYTFDDDATSALPPGESTPIVPGTFRPSSYTTNVFFYAPAPPGPYNLPAPSGAATLDSVFGGIPANGTWSLYAMGFLPPSLMNKTSLDGGWSLTITPGYSVSNTNSIAFQSVVGTPADAANPYPSTISVSGLPGNISRMRVTLNSLTSTCPPDLALLLQGPQGQDMVLMDVVGSCSSVSGVTLTLDDEAASPLSRGSAVLTSGFYKPASYFVGTFGFGQPVFPPNAPQGLYPLPQTDGSATLSSIFAGTDPNGTWSLYVADENRFIPANTGQFAGGWGLQFELACPPTTTTTLNSSPNPSTFSAPVTFSVHVAASSGTPTGPVTFTDTTTSTVLGSPTLDGNGNASIVVSNLSVGGHIISTSYNANYGDNTNFSPSFNNVVQVVNRAATVTTLSSSVNPTTYNQSTTFTAVVMGPGGTPTGSVTFTDTTASTNLSTVPLIAGSASLSYIALSVGSHNITAGYSGDGSYNPSGSNPVVQQVNKAATTTTQVSSQNPSVYGNNPSFTATVHSSNGVTPTSTVNFLDGASSLGTVGLSGGQATLLPASPLAAGAHNITAVYSGDGNFTGSTSPVLVQTINQAATRTIVTSDLNPSNFGQTVTFNTNVTSVGGTPTGTVTFKDGATTFGTATLVNHRAGFTTSALTGGTHTITVSYSSDSNFSGSTSPALVQTVNKINPTMTLTSSLLHVGFRQKTTLLAMASSVNTPTGTVTFMDGAKVLATETLVAGQASLTTDFGSVGLHVVTVLYNGSVNYNPVTSNLINLYRDPRPHGSLPLP